MIKLFTSVLAAASLTVGSVLPGSAAQPVDPYAGHDAHVELARATERTGVNVLVNPIYCLQEDEGPKYLGFYAGQERIIVICQENGGHDNVEVQWTDEDYDTLRHEVQHRIQDCMVGGNHDHQLSSVYREPVDFALSVLGQTKAGRIVNAYRSNGASDHVVVLELEAFAVADLNDPADQIRDLETYCRGPHYASR